jgi:hypothetical protein
MKHLVVETDSKIDEGQAGEGSTGGVLLSCAACTHWICVYGSEEDKLLEKLVIPLSARYQTPNTLCGAMTSRHSLPTTRGI